MRIRYLDWKEGTRRFVDRIKLLKKLFSILLVQEDGDVESALEILQSIGERYRLFDEDLTFEDFKRELLSEKLIGLTPAGFSLTPKGERFIRVESLSQIFTSLKQGVPGDHLTAHNGRGLERLSETRPYQFGDEPADIDYISSFRTALRHLGDDTPTLQEQDLQVFETERHVSVATALLLDDTGG